MLKIRHMIINSFSKGLFWDVDVENLDPVKHQKFIIERVLLHGAPSDVLTVLRVFPRSVLINTIKSSRKLDKKSANYWALHFNIPKPEVSCLSR